MLIRLKKGYIIVHSLSFQKDDFMLNTKSKLGSFSQQIFSKMYDYLFDRTVVLFDEYEQYYSDEFKTFDLFLLKRYRIPEKIILKINKYQSNNIFLYDPGPKYGYSTTLDIILSDEWLPVFDKLIEHQDEN